MKQRRGSGEYLQQRRRRQPGRKHAHLRDNLFLFALFLCAIALRLLFLALEFTQLGGDYPRWWPPWGRSVSGAAFNESADSSARGPCSSGERSSRVWSETRNACSRIRTDDLSFSNIHLHNVAIVGTEIHFYGIEEARWRPSLERRLVPYRHLVEWGEKTSPNWTLVFHNSTLDVKRSCQQRVDAPTVLVSLWHVDNAFHLHNNNLLPLLLHLLEMGALPLPSLLGVGEYVAEVGGLVTVAGNSSGVRGVRSHNSSSRGSSSGGGSSGDGGGVGSVGSSGGSSSDGNAGSTGSEGSRRDLLGTRVSSSLAASANRFLQHVQERVGEAIERRSGRRGPAAAAVGGEETLRRGSMGYGASRKDSRTTGLGLLEGREEREWGQQEEEAGLRVCMLFYLGDERLSQYPTSAVAILWRIFQCRIRLSDSTGLNHRICFRHLAYGQQGAFPFYNSSSSLPGFEKFSDVIAAYRSLAFSLFNIFPAARAVLPEPLDESQLADGPPRRALETPTTGTREAAAAAAGPGEVGESDRSARSEGDNKMPGASHGMAGAVGSTGEVGNMQISDQRHQEEQQRQQHHQQQHHPSLPVPGSFSNGPIVVYFPRSSAFSDDRYVTFIDPWLAAMGERGFHCIVHCCDFTNEPIERHLALFSAAHVMVGLHGAGLVNALYMSPGRLLVEWQDEFALGTGGKDRELLFYWVARHSGLRYLGEDVRPLHVTGHGIVMTSEWAARSAERIADEWQRLMLNT